MAKRRRKAGAASPPRTIADTILSPDEASLLDIVDNVLNKGVVLTGDVTIGLAQIELVYARLSLLLCAADRVLPTEAEDHVERRSHRHAVRVKAGLDHS